MKKWLLQVFEPRLRTTKGQRPLVTIRKEFGKIALVYDPHERRSELERHASYYLHIPRDLPARCQLPDSIPVGTHGNFIRRPTAWK